MARKRKPTKLLNLKLMERFLRDYRNMPYKDKSAIAGAALVLLLLPLSLMFLARPTSPTPIDLAPLDLTQPCYVTGCNNHLCLDAKIDTPAATCPKDPTNYCLDQSRCERQPSGRCGWTETPEYIQCLSSVN